MPSSGTSETAFTVELKRWAGNRPVSSARFDLMESDVRASNCRYFIGDGPRFRRNLRPATHDTRASASLNQPNVTMVARELHRSVTIFY
jgi:hypothetical protein